MGTTVESYEERQKDSVMFEIETNEQEHELWESRRPMKDSRDRWMDRITGKCVNAF